MDIYEYVNVSCIILLETLYFGVLLKLMLNLKKLPTWALFDRSFALVQIANMTNYFESIFNIVQGSLYVTAEHSINLLQFIILIGLIYASRVYSALMSLRILRMYFLYLFRKGEFSKRNFQIFSSPIPIILISNAYALLVVTILTLAVTLSNLQSSFLSYLNNICFIYESACFFLLSSLAYKINSHPTLITEYFLYSIFWVTGCISPFDLKSKWFLIAPIRNNTLLLISYLSLRTHTDYIRPPLPFTIDSENIFQIAELHDDFIKFVELSQNNEGKKSCLLLGELVKINVSENRQVISLRIQEIEEVDKSLVDLIRSSRIEEAKHKISLSLVGLVQEYAESEQYQEFRRNYAIIFN